MQCFFLAVLFGTTFCTLREYRHAGVIKPQGGLTQIFACFGLEIIEFAFTLGDLLPSVEILYINMLLYVLGSYCGGNRRRFWLPKLSLVHIFC